MGVARNFPFWRALLEHATGLGGRQGLPGYEGGLGFRGAAGAWWGEMTGSVVQEEPGPGGFGEGMGLELCGQ